MPPLAGLTEFLQVVRKRQKPLFGFAVIDAVAVGDVFFDDRREALNVAAHFTHVGVGAVEAVAGVLIEFGPSFGV